MHIKYLEKSSVAFIATMWLMTKKRLYFVSVTVNNLYHGAAKQNDAKLHKMKQEISG